MAPLITHVYTADPSAHVFAGKLYIYPSHDVESGIESNDNGDQYDMKDYHVFSIDTLKGITSSDTATEPPKVTDHGAVLRTQDVPWVSKQLWAPDCAYNASTKEYILYFPARDKSAENTFRIGVAVGPSPQGPFTPDPEPIPGSFSIDPACFVDDDGQAYLYFGGLWGGQLQCYQGAEDGSVFDKSQLGPHEPNSESTPALHPKVGILDKSMRKFASPPRDLVILAPETPGKAIISTDHERRFFEAAWMHKYNGTYYFSYSTGDTHFLAYATSTKGPLGPFTYRGKILDPVLGWTTHHSIVEFEGRWWLFYHDCELSQGKNHLRNVKVREIFYDQDGNIVLEKP